MALLLQIQKICSLKTRNNFRSLFRKKISKIQFLSQSDSSINHQLFFSPFWAYLKSISEAINISSVSMDLSMLTQLRVSNEFSLTQILFSLYLLKENLHFFLSRMHFISTCLVFLKQNERWFPFIKNFHLFPAIYNIGSSSHTYSLRHNYIFSPN